MNTKPILSFWHLNFFSEWQCHTIHWIYISLLSLPVKISVPVLSSHSHIWKITNCVHKCVHLTLLRTCNNKNDKIRIMETDFLYVIVCVRLNTYGQSPSDKIYVQKETLGIHMHVCVCVYGYGKYQNLKMYREGILMYGYAFTHDIEIHWNRMPQDAWRIRKRIYRFLALVEYTYADAYFVSFFNVCFMTYILSPDMIFFFLSNPEPDDEPSVRMTHFMSILRSSRMSLSNIGR